MTTHPTSPHPDRMMNATGITKPQLEALIALTTRWRPDNAPTWDPAGIRSVLASLLHLRPDTDRTHLATALLELAADGSQRTPGRLAEHLRTRTTSTSTTATRDSRPELQPYQPPATRAELGGPGHQAALAAAAAIAAAARTRQTADRAAAHTSPAGPREPGQPKNPDPDTTTGDQR